MKPPAITDWCSCLVYADWVRDTSGDEANAAYWQLAGEVRRVLDPVIEKLAGTFDKTSHFLYLPHNFHVAIAATSKLLALGLWHSGVYGELWLARYHWLRHSRAPKRHYGKRTHQLVRRMWDHLQASSSR